MAAVVKNRLNTLCRQFHNLLKVSTQPPVQNATQSLSKFHSYKARQMHDPFWLTCSVVSRNLHTTCATKGLEEFFDLPENWGESTVKSGAPWTAKQLRLKSNEDLHKLWYVLLKEQNMLLTIEQESKRQGVQMPSPERIKKVERSMKRLDTIVKQREDALRLLQTGQEKDRPGEWRRTVFGKTIWYRFKEHPIPWHLNTRCKRRIFFEPPHVAPYTRLSLEKYLKNKIRTERREKRKQKRLAEMFPKRRELQ